MVKVLYKYRGYSDRSLEIIANRQVYFATWEQLNDPFDCRIDIARSLETACIEAKARDSPAVRATLEKFCNLGDFYSNAQADVAKAGIFSLAKSPVSAPMWAHYGSNHKGFCLGFRLSEKFTKHDKDEGIIGVAHVDYCNDNPFTELFHEFAAKVSRGTGDEENLNATWADFWQSIYSAGLTSKNEAWKYEEEARVLKKEGGLVSFEPPELVEVVFGMDMPPSARETIMSLLESSEWGHVRLKEIQRGSGFALKAVAV